MHNNAKTFANIRKFKQVAAELPLDTLDELPSYARVHVLAAAHERLKAITQPIRRWQYVPADDVGEIRDAYQAEAEWNVERWAREVWFVSKPMPTAGVMDSYGNADFVATWHTVKGEMARAGTLPTGDDDVRKKKPKVEAVDALG